MRAGRVSHVLVGLLAFLAWRVAYWFDCADGQLARVTKRPARPAAGSTSWCDVAVQIALVTR